MKILNKLSFLVLLVVAFAVPSIAADVEIEESKENPLPARPLTMQEWHEAAGAIINQTQLGLFLNLAHLIADYSFEAQLKIAAGFYHFLVVYDGQIYAWDSNGRGQLGNKPMEDCLIPCALPLEGYVTKVAAGCDHNLAFTSKGELYAWGSNYHGELGDGSQDQALTPVKMPIKLDIDQMVAAQSYSMVLTKAGQILVCGSHAEGILNLTPQPFDLPLDSNDRLIKIATHGNRSMAFTKNGKVFTWGKFLDLQEKLIKDIIQIAVATRFFLVLTYEGKIWTWGNHYNWELGTPAEPILEPVLVDIQDFIVDIAAGHYHALALTNDGRVYSWGNNQRAQRGLGDNENHLQPTLVPLPHRVINITASADHCMASTEEAKIFTWGSYPCKNNDTPKIFPSPVEVVVWEGIT